MAAADPRAKAYHRAKLRLLAADLVLSGAFLVLLQATGASSALASWASAAGRPKALEVLIYLVAFFQLYYAVSLPTHFISTFLMEKKYGLSTLRLSGWIKDALKKYALTLGFFVILLELLYFTVDRFPETWWLVAGTGWLFITLFLSRILPTLIIPIFYKLKALPAGALRDALTDLFKRCRVPFLEIYEIELSKKTKKANAALVGIGRSRRVLLGDTLLEHYTPAEVEMVMAHELGHHVKRHIPRVVAFNTASTLIGFYLLHLFSGRVVEALGAEGLTDLAIFPALMLLAGAGGLFLMPLQNSFSRRHERQADQFALDAFPSKEVFVSLMRKLGKQNLSDLEPNPVVEFMLYDHPSISKRIQWAETHLST